MYTVHAWAGITLGGYMPTISTALSILYVHLLLRTYTYTMIIVIIII